MKFEIIRASNIKGDKCPVDGAVEESSETWLVELNTLEDLLQLIDRAGSDLIVSKKSSFHEHRAIWIYDDYME